MSILPIAHLVLRMAVPGVPQGRQDWVQRTVGEWIKKRLTRRRGSTLLRGASRNLCRSCLVIRMPADALHALPAVRDFARDKRLEPTSPRSPHQTDRASGLRKLIDKVRTTAHAESLDPSNQEEVHDASV